MLFTCKNFAFSDFLRKNKFAPTKKKRGGRGGGGGGGGGGEGARLPLPTLSFVFGPSYFCFR